MSSGSGTTFFTACNRAYEPFVIPYALSVLHHNNDAAVEVCVEDPTRFADENEQALAILASAYPDRLLVRGGTYFGRVRPGSVRFVEEPILQAEFTYIGDVDILVLEGDIATIHSRNMAKTGLPYSNVLRATGDRLTGLHFTPTNLHYPFSIAEDARTLRTLGDEQILYRLVLAKGLPLPDPKERYRPVHGWHLSLHRPPTGREVGSVRFGWGLHRRFLDAYTSLISSPVWEETSQVFSPAYKFLLAILNGVAQAQFPDHEIYQPKNVQDLFFNLSAASVTLPQSGKFPARLQGG